MDLGQAVMIMEAMRWTPMTPLEMQDMEQFRFAKPRPTYKDITQILVMLERFNLVTREGVGDSTTSDWRLSSDGRGISSALQLQQYIEDLLVKDRGLGEREEQIIAALAEVGGRSDVQTLRGRLGLIGNDFSDDFYQSLAEIQAMGMMVVGWGQTERDYPFLRLTRKGWYHAVTGQ